MRSKNEQRCLRMSKTCKVLVYSSSLFKDLAGRKSQRGSAASQQRDFWLLLVTKVTGSAFGAPQSVKLYYRINQCLSINIAFHTIFQIKSFFSKTTTYMSISIFFNNIIQNRWKLRQIKENREKFVLDNLCQNVIYCYSAGISMPAINTSAAVQKHCLHIKKLTGGRKQWKELTSQKNAPAPEFTVSWAEWHLKTAEKLLLQEEKKAEQN